MVSGQFFGTLGITRKDTMNPITTIDQLRNELAKGPDQDGYMGILKRVQLDLEKEVLPLCAWSDEHYTRIPLFRNSDCELLLMCWEPHQTSPIHTYDYQEGWMYILQGELCIEQYFTSMLENQLKLIESTRLPEKSIPHLNDYIGFHRGFNCVDRRTISLHIYSLPIETWQVYDQESKRIHSMSVWSDPIQK